MRTAEFIQRCLDAGLDVATALTAAKAFEAECEIALEAHLDLRRVKERARQAKHRAKKTEAGHVVSRDITLDDVTTVSERDLTHERSQVEDTTSSLRSEDNPPTHPSGASPAKPKSKTARSRLVPDGWAPPPKVMTDLTDQGFSPGEIERELANFRDHEFRDPKTAWDLAFRKWMRNSRSFQPRKAHEPTRANQKFSDSQANLARAFAGADSASRRDWKP